MRALLALAVLWTACSSGCGVPGACEEDASRRQVFVADGPGRGLPAYEGQALIIRSCGYGTHCHSEDIDLDSRNAVPTGLDFDVRIAASGAEAGDVERLDRNQRRVFGMRGEIWHQVTSGLMPPGGIDAAAIRDGAPLFRRIGTSEPLPEIESTEGREILRNWLACGTPVIERTQPRGDGAPNLIGFTVPYACSAMTDCEFATVPRCDLSLNVCGPCLSDTDCAHLGSQSMCDARSGSCFEPAVASFRSIHEIIIGPRCATAACHVVNGERRPAGRLDLESRADAYTNMIDVPADGSIFCRGSGLVRVTPGDPDASLLYLKLTSELVCGEHMPLGQDAIPEQYEEVIREWIADGAAND